MKLLLMFILTSPFLAFAEPTITVTSFLMTDHRNLSSSTAELCGVIQDNSKKIHEKVVIIADPGKGQGYYVANVTASGRFCHIIRTTTLRAQVDIYNQPQTQTNTPSYLSPIFKATNR